MLLGFLLAAAGALATTALVTSTGHRVPVLVTARSIAPGAVVTQADLVTATISGAGMATIPAREENQVAGRTAAVGVPAGTLLVPADLTSTAVPAAGQQLVPVPLKASQLPASGLNPGAQVLVTATPGAAGQAGATQDSSQTLPGDGVPATVYRVSAPDENSDVTVDLIVAAQDGVPLAKQASTGQIALVVTGSG